MIGFYRPRSILVSKVDPRPIVALASERKKNPIPSYPCSPDRALVLLFSSCLPPLTRSIFLPSVVFVLFPFLYLPTDGVPGTCSLFVSFVYFFYLNAESQVRLLIFFVSDVVTRSGTRIVACLVTYFTLFFPRCIAPFFFGRCSYVEEMEPWVGFYPASIG